MLSLGLRRFQAAFTSFTLNFNGQMPSIRSISCRFSSREGWIHVCFHLMDGQLCFPSDQRRLARPVAFEELQLDLEIQLSLLLMGLSLPAVALPKLLLSLDVSGKKLQVVCREAGEEEAPPHAEDWSSQAHV